MDKHAFMRACREGGDSIEDALRVLDRSLFALLYRECLRSVRDSEAARDIVVSGRGARRVVASLWQVEDESTALLMRELYRGLQSAQSDVPRALRRAQLALRALRADGGRCYEHPYYWAGFVVSAGAP